MHAFNRSQNNTTATMRSSLWEAFFTVSELQQKRKKKGLHVCFLYNAKWHFGVSAIDSFTVSMWSGKNRKPERLIFKNFHSLGCKVRVVSPIET